MQVSAISINISVAVNNVYLLVFEQIIIYHILAYNICLE